MNQITAQLRVILVPGMKKVNKPGLVFNLDTLDFGRKFLEVLLQ
jgi:hypothetical protein